MKKQDHFKSAKQNFLKLSEQHRVAESEDKQTALAEKKADLELEELESLISSGESVSALKIKTAKRKATLAAKRRSVANKKSSALEFPLKKAKAEFRRETVKKAIEHFKATGSSEAQKVTELLDSLDAFVKHYIGFLKAFEKRRTLFVPNGDEDLKDISLTVGLIGNFVSRTLSESPVEVSSLLLGYIHENKADDYPSVPFDDRRFFKNPYRRSKKP